MLGVSNARALRVVTRMFSLRTVSLMVLVPRSIPFSLFLSVAVAPFLSFASPRVYGMRLLWRLVLSLRRSVLVERVPVRVRFVVLNVPCRVGSAPEIEKSKLLCFNDPHHDIVI